MHRLSENKKRVKFSRFITCGLVGLLIASGCELFEDGEPDVAKIVVAVGPPPPPPPPPQPSISIFDILPIPGVNDYSSVAYLNPQIRDEEGPEIIGFLDIAPKAGTRLSALAPSSSVSIDISLSAIGADLPPNVEENRPGWTLRAAPFWLDSYVVEPQAANTQLVIQIDPEVDITGLARNAAQDGISVLTGYVCPVPSNVPPLFTVTGKRRIDVLVPLPLAVETREDEEVGSAELRVSPGLYAFDSASETVSFALQNSGGEELTLLDVTFSGPDADLFSLVDGLTLPHVLQPGTTRAISIQCSLPGDFELHRASMNVIHDAGSKSIPLQARQ